MTEKTKTFWKQVVEVGQVMAWTFALCMVVWMAAAGLGRIIGSIGAQGNEIVQNQVQLEDHEQRLRTLDHEIQQMSVDLRWIRKTLEQWKEHPSR